MGASNDPAETPTPPPTPQPTAPVVDPPDPGDGDEPLGDAGVKALEAMKLRARAAEAELKRLKPLEAELETLRTAQLTDHEKAIADARKEAADQARTEIQTALNGRLFASELRAATAGKLLPAAAQDLLVDPTVAVKLLGLDEIPVTETGDIDGEAISQAVDAYVTSRPHLAASATPPMPGPIDQGSRPPTGVKSLDEQIADAVAAKDWRLAGSLKNRKLMQA